MKVAALDLGSNTFLLLICEVVDGQITQVYQDKIHVTKLGQGVHANKKLHPEALLRADICLKEYSEIIAAERPEKILAMATSAARDVTNSDELFKIGKKYGIPIQIIPGKLEAEITFSGATYDLAEKKGIAIIDVGGGSTEIIALNNEDVAQGVSVNVGSVRLTEMFVTGHPVTQYEVEQLLKYAEAEFSKIKNILPNVKLNKSIGVAGTPTTLAAVMQEIPYSDAAVHEFKIKNEDLLYWLNKLAAMNLESRKFLVGMDPQRADVMIAGMAILYAANCVLNKTELYVSTRGVRNGVALYAAKI